jgi:hypothetical protein
MLHITGVNLPRFCHTLPISSVRMNLEARINHDKTRTGTDGTANQGIFFCIESAKEKEA